MQTPQDRVSTFFHTGAVLTIKKGTILMRPEDPVKQIYYLTKGIVKMDYIAENGDEITLHIFEQNSAFPLMLLLANQPNRYILQAMTPCTLYTKSSAEVMQFLTTNPDVVFDLTIRFAKGITGLMQKITTIICDDAYHKIVSLLIYLAKKFGKQEKDKITLTLALTHTDIAYWLGMQRETASRQLEKLMKKGLVTHHNHFFCIENITLLEKELTPK